MYCLLRHLFVVSLLFSTCYVAAEAEHQFFGKLSVVASYSDALETASMSRVEGKNGFDTSTKVQLSYEYFDDAFGIFSHVQATSEGDSVDGNYGIVELYGYYRFTFDDARSLDLSLGQFFMPTSLENSDDFWGSPYTNSYSALNTWIAQEVRPLGVEVRFDNAPEQTNKAAYGFGTMAFVGNDAMGAMLTWKGWSIGRHQTVYGEVLNLPEIYHVDEGAFAEQREDGTKPFGRDLDHNVGYLAHGYYSPNADWVFKLAYIDTQGDGHLYRGEYAWANYFTVAGVKWWPNEQWTVLVESMFGRTAMGYPGWKGTAVDFNTSYVLLSYKRQQWHYTMRFESFEADDKASFPSESNDSGNALTIAAKWQAFGRPWSIIGEWLYIDVDGRRTRALDNGVFIDEDESQMSISLNYSF